MRAFDFRLIWRASPSLKCLGVVALLGGCVPAYEIKPAAPTAKSLIWTKPGASPTDFNVDDGQCKAQAFSVVTSDPMQTMMVHGFCMRGKGWVLAP